MFVESFKESALPPETIKQHWAPRMAGDVSSDEIGADGLQWIPATLHSSASAWLKGS